MKKSSIRTYLISETIGFKKTKEAFGGLSNMAPGYNLHINDILIPSAEHLYQACRFPYNPEVQFDIIHEKSPMNAKWVSRANDHLSRKDWNQVRFKIMRWAIDIKLSQNWNTFSELLRETGDKFIVEVTNKDKIWGAVKKDDAYVGTNALGRLLMDVRQELMKNPLRKACIEPIDIPDFLLYGHQINTVCDDDYSDFGYSFRNEDIMERT